MKTFLQEDFMDYYSLLKNDLKNIKNLRSVNISSNDFNGDSYIHLIFENNNEIEIEIEFDNKNLQIMFSLNGDMFFHLKLKDENYFENFNNYFLNIFQNNLNYLVV